jgi:hypothetical protein
MYEPHEVTANVGAMPAAAGTVYCPIFYVPAGPRITVLGAFVSTMLAATATLNLVDLGTDGVTETATICKLGSLGTATIYTAGSPIKGTMVSGNEVVSPTHFIGVKCGPGTASLTTIVEFSYLNAINPS